MSAPLTRDGDRLVFAGPLDRAAVAALWPQALAQAAGAACFDLRAVERVDSAGLALLAELAVRAGGPVRIEGTPPGLVELRTAYRLDAGLGYAR
ncbi:STAS domain-containing protein [Vulcaniibacterium gelatinicum]|uniref:STAS domain-containing protein n=1 Tax=Vulcaniibacterium gelatinicum TaxID=2598725 RepID=UPI0011CC9F0A|nr:STAS domain-containing protein [Vulcaniibacterium gelatinicum]